MKNLILLLLTLTACHQKQAGQKSVFVTHTSQINSNKMENINNFFNALYKDFNERKIDLVISRMSDKVKWANGMDGGYVYGYDGVKEYWTRQFKIVSSNVTPVIINTENEVVKIKVHQIVHDLNGNLLADEFVYHYFHLENGKISEFDIGEKVRN